MSSKMSVDQALMKAKSHIKNNEITEAQKLYQTVLLAFPHNKRAQEGLASLNKPNHNNSLKSPSQDAINQLMSLYNQGQLSLVVQQAKDLTEQYPEAFIIWNILGVSAAQIGQLDQAITSFQKVISLNPDCADAYSNMGLSLHSQGKMNQAIAAYKKAINIKPDYAEAYNNLGNSLKVQGKLNEAISAYNKAIKIRPDYAEVFNNLGVVLQDQNKLKQSICSYKKAILFKSDYAEAFFNLGSAFKDTGELDEAIQAYNKALLIDPNYAEAYCNMGVALQVSGKLEKSLEAYKNCILLKPDYSEAYINSGNALQDQGKFEEAIKAYNVALSLKPNNAEIYYNKGSALRSIGKLKEAIDAFGKAFFQKPDHEAAQAFYLNQLAHICDWSSIAKDRKLIPSLGISKKSVDPFSMFCLEDAPERHLIRSENYSKEKFKQKSMPFPVKQSNKSNRIHIGYFSADFHNHATMYLMAKVFATHDKKKFKIHAYSYGPVTQDEMRKRLISDVDIFHDVVDMDDMKIVKLARKDKLDIAIDLKGFTRHQRLGIFAYGLAPLQISYLGYPGTLGTKFIDYIIADPIVIPDHKKEHYSEKIIYLPNTYQPTDNTRFISQKNITKEEMGLPSSGFIFCCFNSSYKITPREFDIWMRLLGKVEKSVLWLLKSNPWAINNLKREAEARGISADRIIFADKVLQEDHLARHKFADLFLDTFNVNAHTTASDALWSGLPVVTKIGKGFVARVASSLLNAVGLPELVTESEYQYETLILELANNPKKLLNIKEKLQRNRSSFPLFNTELYTKHLEKAYLTVYENYNEANLAKTIHIR